MRGTANGAVAVQAAVASNANLYTQTTCPIRLSVKTEQTRAAAHVSGIAGGNEKKKIL